MTLLNIWEALVSVDAFQLSLFGFVYFPFAQSSSFFPKILKLTQNLGINRSYSIPHHKKYVKSYKLINYGLFYTYFSN